MGATASPGFSFALRNFVFLPFSDLFGFRDFFVFSGAVAENLEVRRRGLGGAMSRNGVKHSSRAGGLSRTAVLTLGMIDLPTLETTH